MKRYFIIMFSLLLISTLVLMTILFGDKFMDWYRNFNDPTLYQGFKIIEEKQITAEDGMAFYTIQVDMNHPKTPYRLYVFPTEEKKHRLLFVDSYSDKFNPKVDFIMRSNDESYYVIEEYIINYSNGEFSTLSAKSLNAFGDSKEELDEYAPVIKILVEQGSWYWLYEGAEFLLKTEEREYMLEVLRSFESNNQDKIEHSEPYYRSVLTYETMVEKCNELLQKYGGE